MQRRKDKVKDKPPDPHREYLDAESTDEEERQKHTEEEVVEELRPVYDEEELTELVNCVKDMTTLSGLVESDWTYYSERTIREFFKNPNLAALTVYFVRDRLTVSLMFPLIPVHELTYFVRESQEILRADNFRDRVLFGSVNGKVESHILSVMQNVLTPIFVKIETWPDSILSRLNSCLISLPTWKVAGYPGTVA
ncbi:dynein axonemal heavy chain 2 [Megachile rotundata]|uniref:dynein axonemal heavy chain 2 n=1 Tax=Megachile rotundata TaxID=143995 RepID=UPI003FD24EB8